MRCKCIYVCLFIQYSLSLGMCVGAWDIYVPELHTLITYQYTHNDLSIRNIHMRPVPGLEAERENKLKQGTQRWTLSPLKLSLLLCSRLWPKSKDSLLQKGTLVLVGWFAFELMTDQHLPPPYATSQLPKMQKSFNCDMTIIKGVERLGKVSHIQRKKII